MRCGFLILLSFVFVASASALEGKNGYDGTLLFTSTDVHASVGYPPGHAGVRWQDLARLEFWAPIPGNGGRRDGIAAAANGDVFFLVLGRDDTAGEVPHHTGLIRFDGAAFHHVTSYEMDSGFFQTRIGVEIDGVIVSPSDGGPLSRGHPVLLLEVIERVTLPDGTTQRQNHAEIVSVDPLSGAETFLASLETALVTSARLAIDGSGGARDGTIYVGPMADGTIQKLAWNPDSASYEAATIPGGFVASQGIQVDGDGRLYAFAENISKWSTLVWKYPEHEIHEIDPDSGASWLYAEVDGHHFIFDWDWAHGGPQWLGVRKSGRSARRAVTPVVPGGVTGSANGISDSSHDAWSIAAGPAGEIYVMENPFGLLGEIHVLTPGTGDGGGGGKGNGHGRK